MVPRVSSQKLGSLMPVTHIKVNWYTYRQHGSIWHGSLSSPPRPLSPCSVRLLATDGPSARSPYFFLQPHKCVMLKKLKDTKPLHMCVNGGVFSQVEMEIKRWRSCDIFWRVLFRYYSWIGMTSTKWNPFLKNAFPCTLPLSSPASPGDGVF